MSPVVALMLRPSGKPLAAYVSVTPARASTATSGKSIGSPSLETWSPGGVRVTGLLTVQVNDSRLLYVPSVAVTVLKNGPLPAAPAAMVPAIRPVVELMDRPSGSPAAA